MDAGVILERRREVGEVAVEREAKGAANGGDATNNIRVVDGGCIPGVASAMGGFGGDLGVARPLVDSDAKCFVEEAEESFDRDGLVVAFEGGFAGKAECFAHVDEVFLERGPSIGSDEEAESNFEEDVFHECGGQGCGIDRVKVCDDGKGGEVAHDAEDVFGAGVGSDIARLPYVDVQNREWGGDGPRVHEFAIAADGGIGENAVGARFQPCFNVGTELVPVES